MKLDEVLKSLKRQNEKTSDHTKEIKKQRDKLLKRIGGKKWQ